MTGKIRWKFSAILLVLFVAGGANAEGLTPQQQLAHDIYKELIEIDTTTATGDTARAAEAMAARLKAAGFADGDVHAFSPAPRKGNLVARLHGSGATDRSCWSRISTSFRPSARTGRSNRSG